ncbi:MAG: peptidoglycan DD-metalloendopeptidase family protein [Deltaproteobacteria bacterium]
MMDIKSLGSASMMSEAAANRKDTPEAIKKALVEFEALFINQMLKTMRESIEKTSLFHGGNGEETYASMFDMELSRALASAGGIGLEKTFMKQFLKEYGIGPEKGLNAPHGPGEVTDPGQTPDEKEGAWPGDANYGADRGRLSRFPLPGRISSYFGARKDPFTGDEKFHHGLDIAAKEGAPVYPAAPGKVIFSGKKDGYGNVVEILHANGVITRYGHNAGNLVKDGDTADTREPIAYVGSTGRSTGPHLHFEVIMDGRSVDPERLLYG